MSLFGARVAPGRGRLAHEKPALGVRKSLVSSVNLNYLYLEPQEFSFFQRLRIGNSQNLANKGTVPELV